MVSCSMAASAPSVSGSIPLFDITNAREEKEQQRPRLQRQSRELRRLVPDTPHDGPAVEIRALGFAAAPAPIASADDDLRSSFGAQILAGARAPLPIPLTKSRTGRSSTKRRLASPYRSPRALSDATSIPLRVASVSSGDPSPEAPPSMHGGSGVLRSAASVAVAEELAEGFDLHRGL